MDTPPGEFDPVSLSTGIKVLNAQAATLATIAGRYSQEGSLEQANFARSVDLLRGIVLAGGKIVFTAMGKSLKIGEKLAATLNSLGILSTTLHPTEALHGDLGALNSSDAVVMITASGATPELLALRPHLPGTLFCLTGNADSPLGRAAVAVLEACVPPEHAELSVYGLAAPSMSTTACLAVGDAMCITLNEMLVASAKSRVQRFGKWHPGGAIGQMYRENQMVPMADIGRLENSLLECSELELWRASSCHEFVLEGPYLYASKDLVAWLKMGRLSLPHMVDIRQLPCIQEHLAPGENGFCVVMRGQTQLGLMVARP